MEVKQTTLEWLKEQFEKDGDTTFLNLNWDRFDELFEQAKEMDDEFLEKLKDFDTWREWKNSSMKTKETKFNVGEIVFIIETGRHDYLVQNEDGVKGVVYQFELD
jgi:hypothetical protein